MSLRQLFRTSPLGCVGTFLLGAVFACQFGMGPVFATAVGLGTAEISIFIGAIYVGGLVMQYPIGWCSDRMDRRTLITIVTLAGTAGCLIALVFNGSFYALVATGFLIGGSSNPLYSLLIAHTNDFLANEDMASASGGLIVLNGVGAAGTPIFVGYLMHRLGPLSYLAFIALIMTLIAAYAMYRMTVRPARSAVETSPIAPMSMVSGTQVSAEIAQEYITEQAAADSPSP
jgi:MFS family permease